ncbi:MAG: electron transfer flavoprotein subunit alpha/FixB family protein [Chloroflexi bacterium]|nr:electron transfer flavoprotein subunit alpha/FixB family protein [Chloroflexota bacterium]
MDDILVLVEHRQGEVRDITFEMLGKGRQLAASQGAKLTAVLLGSGSGKLAEQVASQADTVEVINHEAYADFNSDTYQRALANLIAEREPLLCLIGHTSYGIDLAPSLATQLSVPLITDVVDLNLDSGSIVATRMVYGGKARARVRAKSPGAIVTVQPGAFTAAESGAKGEIITTAGSLPGEKARKRFLEFIEAASEGVDIAQSEIVVSVGRGIGDPKDIPLVEELATALGAVLACSRPVVDKRWLPKSRQVGISGKTIKPKLYLAIGISGAFQHLSAVKGSGMVVAVNKDPKAPIFRAADYGIVGDLFKVVPALTERIRQAKNGK